MRKSAAATLCLALLSVEALAQEHDPAAATAARAQDQAAEASFDYVIGNASQLQKADVKNDLSAQQSRLRQLKEEKLRSRAGTNPDGGCDTCGSLMETMMEYQKQQAREARQDRKTAGEQAMQRTTDSPNADTIVKASKTQGAVDPGQPTASDNAVVPAARILRASRKPPTSAGASARSCDLPGSNC